MHLKNVGYLRSVGIFLFPPGGKEGKETLLLLLPSLAPAVGLSVMEGSSAPMFVIPAVVVVGQQYLSPYPIDLVVSEKTLSLTDSDYAVKDLNGNVMFKVKGVLMSMRDKCRLLDPAGNPILTLREKIRTMHDRWQAFRGESSDSKDCLYSVKKSSMIQLKTSLDVFLAENTKEQVPDFKIHGSFLERSCTITNGDGSIVVAQMCKRYTAMNLVRGKDAFGVTVYPNVDYAFIVSLIVILDQVNKED